MLETKKSRRAFVNIIFDGTLYIGIGVSIGTLLNSPIIGFMGVLMASMMKRMIGNFQCGCAMQQCLKI